MEIAHLDFCRAKSFLLDWTGSSNSSGDFLGIDG